MRIALGVEYDGSAYSGWQAQNHTPNTVQARLEEALSQVADQEVKVICAGRTDTGVHATQQVVHFDTTAVRDQKAWVMGGTVNLPWDICIRWAQPVNDKFHARFSAESRMYRYLIYNDPVRPALLKSQVTWNYRPLQVELMQQAADDLVGENDFTAYRAVACQAKSPVRTVEYIRLRRHGQMVIMDIKANAFLQHMVRNIAGVLMSIGCGNNPVAWASEVLASRDRAQGGVTAPPYGLYFVGVDYPAHFQLPQPVEKIPVMPY